MRDADKLQQSRANVICRTDLSLQIFHRKLGVAHALSHAPFSSGDLAQQLASCAPAGSHRADALTLAA